MRTCQAGVCIFQIQLGYPKALNKIKILLNNTGSRVKVTSTAQAPKLNFGIWWLLGGITHCGISTAGSKQSREKITASGGRSCISHGEGNTSSRECCDFQLLRRDKYLTEHIIPFLMVLMTDHVGKHNMIPCSVGTAYFQASNYFDTWHPLFEI